MKIADKLKSFIEDFPDFPQKGIIFRDISPLLENQDVFATTMNALCDKVKDKKFNKIIGIDARGFIFASAMAYKLKKSFVICRKPGKLPGKLITQNYNYEYSSTAISIQQDKLKKEDKILIVDDVLASGNTALAAYKIAQRKAKVVGLLFLIELSNLSGRKYLLQETGLKDSQILSIAQY